MRDQASVAAQPLVTRSVDPPQTEEGARRIPHRTTEPAPVIPAHLAPLEPYRAEIAAGGRLVPRFDPRDGGADARLLILLETPGPSPSPLAMVSRDNAGGTARNLRRFLDEAGIARAETLLWNVVPWIVHAPGARNRALRRGEIAAGVALVPRLLDRLPRLAAVVLAGRPAAMASEAIRAARPGLPVLAMPHPSPTYVCTSPMVAARIAATLADARRLLAARAARGAIVKAGPLVLGAAMNEDVAG